MARFDAFCDHLRRLGLLSAPVEGRRLGGWLKMGMVGTVAARGRIFLVGDAAGLVNPLQGEGIAPAMTSAAAAAEAILAGPGISGSPLPPPPGRWTGSVRVGGGANPRRGDHRVTSTGSRSSVAPSPCPASVPPSPRRGR